MVQFNLGLSSIWFGVAVGGGGVGEGRHSFSQQMRTSAQRKGLVFPKRSATHAMFVDERVLDDVNRMELSRILSLSPRTVTH